MIIFIIGSFVAAVLVCLICVKAASIADKEYILLWDEQQNWNEED